MTASLHVLSWLLVLLVWTSVASAQRVAGPSALVRHPGHELSLDSRDEARVLTSPAPQAGAQFGFSVALADFNADGVVDIAVGAKGQTVGGVPSHGAAFVLWGPEYDTSVMLDGFGLGDSAWFGASLDSTDIDRDGYPDLVVGAPLADVGSLVNAGLAYAYFGPDFSRSTLLTSPYIQAGAIFGGPVETGDFNGDGYGDVAIGSPFSDVIGVSSAGDVHVFYGPDLIITSRVFNLPPISGEVFGSCLASGRISDRSFDDLVIGASSAPVGGVDDAGNAFIYHGPHFLSATPLGNPDPKEVGRYGRDACVADFDGDGHRDIGISAYRAKVGPFEEAGEVFVFFGPSMTRTTYLTQPIPQHTGEYGVALAAGDIDGDGRAELGVGTEFGYLPGPIFSAGMTFVYYGPDLDVYTRLIEPMPEDGAVFGFSLAMRDLKSSTQKTAFPFSIAIGAINGSDRGLLNAGRLLLY